MDDKNEKSLHYVMEKLKTTLYENKNFAKGKNNPYRRFLKTLVDVLYELQEHPSICPSDNSLEDLLSCRICDDILFDPLTLKCGHTFCRNCVKKRFNQSYVELCAICGKDITLKWSFTKRKPIDSYQCNVALASILQDCFEDYVEAVQLRGEGNQYFSKCDYGNAMKKYNEAVAKYPTNFMSWSNISYCELKQHNYQESLVASQRAIAISPWWSKAYYREGLAYLGMNCYLNSLESLLKYLMIDPSDDVVKKQFSETLEDLLSKDLKDESQIMKRYSNGEPLDKIIDFNVNKLFEKSQHCVENPEDTEMEDLKGCYDQEMINTPPLEKVRKNNINESKLDIIMRLLMKSGIQFAQMSKIGSRKRKSEEEMVSVIQKVRTELTCPLCCRILYRAATTPCGHTFCSTCLERSLDYNNSCGICRKPLEELIKVRPKPVNLTIENIVKHYFRQEYEERVQSDYAEMQVFSEAEEKVTIPIFVCTFTYPSLDCPLHIFEPRYKLLVRRCLESGTYMFGMCMYDEEKIFSDYGIMLVIKDHKSLEDGRFLVDAVGGKRFQVHERGRKDGYNTAKITWVKDDPIPEPRQSFVRSLSTTVYQESRNWINQLPSFILDRLQIEYGGMPDENVNEIDSENGPQWVWWMLRFFTQRDQERVINFLKSTNLEHRLNYVREKVAELNFINPS